ncbi:hypothetical protein ACTU3I_06900 [Microbacterium sp. RD1]|uniref:hypothetical protein n=1 Tax=Microbacterium sp. RD1 TaxID=3457313 RepID=UPI003FA58EAE
MAKQDPELLLKRVLLTIFGVLAIGGGVISVTACVRAFVVHGDSPLMLIGILGGLAAIAAGFYYLYLVMNPSRSFPRR